MRMFVREGAIDPLSTALLAILKDKDENRGANENENGNGNGEMEERQGQEQGQSMMEQASRAVGVLLFFCQVAQADARVREAFATRTVMMRMLPILLFPKTCAYLISDSNKTFFHPKLQCDSILKTLNPPTSHTKCRFTESMRSLAPKVTRHSHQIYQTPLHIPATD